MGRRRRSHGKKMAGKKKQHRASSRPQPFIRSIANVVASGVRTLLPGLGTGAQVLTDFALKQISQALGDGGATVANYCGLSGVVGIRYTQLMASSPFVAPEDGTSTINRGKFRTQFMDARLVSLAITVSNAAKLSGRAGTMTIAFLPISDKEDCTAIKTQLASNPPTEYSLRRALHTRSGPAGRPITLLYKPRAIDGLVAKFNPITSCFGIVAVYYNNPLRDNWKEEFKQDAFDPVIQISGKVALKNSALGTHSITAEDKTEDILPQTLDEYRYEDGLGWHIMAKGRCLPGCVCESSLGDFTHLGIRGESQESSGD